MLLSILDNVIVAIRVRVRVRTSFARQSNYRNIMITYFSISDHTLPPLIEIKHVKSMIYI